MSEIFSGVIQYFNKDRGFGMIRRDGAPPDQQDDFVHISAAKRAGIAELQEGMRLYYQIEASGPGRRLQAVDLRIDHGDLSEPEEDTTVEQAEAYRSCG